MRTHKHGFGWIAGALTMVCFVAVGCWPFDFTTDAVLMGQICEDGSVSCFAGSGGGGTGGTGGAGGAPPECVPSEDNKIVEDDCGVFVSSSLGAAGGKGTKEEPFATIKEAVAESNGAPVYVCGEILTEELKMESGDITLYGALDCTNGWVYDPAKKTTLTAEPDKVPLGVGKDASAAIFDFHIEAASATAEGGSSIAVIAAEGATLELERCEVVAGDGANGVPGEKQEPVAPAPAGKNGTDGCGDMDVKSGGGAGSNMCELTSHNGGLGGSGSTTDGGAGTSGQPAGDSGKGGEPQTSTQPTCTEGGEGANGTPGTPGDGASGIGLISGAGYLGLPGSDGQGQSTPGQGGGGGGGAKLCLNNNAGPGGGGGGAGGCGGSPGKGGGPAGSSIGVLSDGATVTLTDVSITTAKGGEGGLGGDGQPGQLGGNGGNPGAGDGQAQACAGGKGGKGGDGGPGGGGLGGHSLAIAFVGNAPLLTDVTMDLGIPGEGGDGGAMTMEPAAKGASGLACKWLSFDEGAGSCIK